MNRDEPKQYLDLILAKQDQRKYHQEVIPEQKQG